MKRIAFTITFALILAPTVVSASSFEERLCKRVEKNFSDNPIMLSRVNDRIERRFDFRCEDRSKQVDIPQEPAESTPEPSARYRVSVIDRSQVRSTNRRRVQESILPTSDQGKLRDLIDDPSSTFEQQAMLVTSILDAMEQLTPLELEKHIDDVTDLIVLHMKEGFHTPSVVRHNSALPRLILLIEKSRKTQNYLKIQPLLVTNFLKRGENESAESLEKRKQLILDMWYKRKIAIVYWNEFLDLSDEGQEAMDWHYGVMDFILKDEQGFPLGSEYARMILIRDDHPATASEGTLWLPPRVSYRTYIHEMGHVLNFTNKEVESSFQEFTDLFDDSGEDDFFTQYHPHAYEDFAEVYTEYVLGGTNKRRHPIQRAYDSAEKGQFVKLEKIFFLLKGINDPSLIKQSEYTYGIRRNGEARFFRFNEQGRIYSFW